MNPADQRKFDSFGARVLRSSVTGMKRVTGVLRKPAFEPPAHPERILVVKLWGLGGLVCASPALAALRQRYPDATITLLTAKGLERLYDGAGLYDHALSWEASELGDLPGAVRKFRERARDLRFDLAVCLDGLHELAALLTHVSGAPATAGFVPKAGRRRGYTLPVVFDPDKHGAEALLDLPRALGVEHPAPALVAPRVRSTEQEQMRTTLAKWGVDEHLLLVGINMDTNEIAANRSWPAEKFVLLAQSIEELGEYKTVFLGAPEEERFITRHVKHMDTQPINLAGRTSVRQLAALLTHLHLVVTCDAGLLQLAAALDVPTVAVFARSSLEHAAPPPSERHAVIDRRRYADAQDGQAHPLREVTVDEVRGVVEDLLDHLADPDDPPWTAPLA